ncbi:MAG: His/Gly/Thr/Pro-type tRNA ligase C-terminal domain-containing protein [Patescibacteria group bacterium]
MGTPWCITIDYDTLKDNTVTVRDRDTTKQDRVSIDRIVDFIREKLKD